LVVDDPGQAPTDAALLPLNWQTPAEAYPQEAIAALDPYRTDRAQLLDALKQRGILDERNPTDPDRMIYRSETGEVTIDAPRDILILDTRRTAGGYAPQGATFEAPVGGVSVEIAGAGATVWVSALDPHPISSSRRLLLTHLTDLQNSGIRYAEPGRQTLLDWGGLPYLVRAGRAEVRVRLASPARYDVWALAPDGRRLRRVDSVLNQGELEFTADVAGDPENGATMLYEIVAK
jgi:hypothetical protein